MIEASHVMFLSVAQLKCLVFCSIFPFFLVISPVRLGFWVPGEDKPLGAQRRGAHLCQEGDEPSWVKAAWKMPCPTPPVSADRRGQGSGACDPGR